MVWISLAIIASQPIAALRPRQAPPLTAKANIHRDVAIGRAGYHKLMPANRVRYVTETMTGGRTVSLIIVDYE